MLARGRLPPRRLVDDAAGSLAPVDSASARVCAYRPLVPWPQTETPASKNARTAITVACCQALQMLGDLVAQVPELVFAQRADGLVASRPIV